MTYCVYLDKISEYDKLAFTRGVIQMFKKMIYETDRLWLKVLKPTDCREVLDYYKRNRHFLKEWDPTPRDEFYTLWYQKDELRYEYNLFKKNKLMKLWLVKKEDKRLIGNLCFSSIVMGNFKSCYLGYKLDKDEINKGYMTEAIRKAVRIMFDEYGLHRIEVNIMPRNVRSLRVMEKLGFEHEGQSRRYLEVNGVWEDHVHFACYNDDM